jgi:ribonuclease G
MVDEINRELVFNALKSELEKDRNKTSIQKISELGLIEMTRQRRRKSLSKIMCESCPHCGGLGIVKSKTTVCYEIFRELERESARNLTKTICLLVHPDVAHMLMEDERKLLEKLEQRLTKELSYKPTTAFTRTTTRLYPCTDAAFSDTDGRRIWLITT